MPPCSTLTFIPGSFSSSSTTDKVKALLCRTSSPLIRERLSIGKPPRPEGYFSGPDTQLTTSCSFSQDMTLVDMPLPMSFMMCYGRKQEALTLLGISPRIHGKVLTRNL